MYDESHPLYNHLSGQLIIRSGRMRLPSAMTGRYLSSFVRQAIWHHTANYKRIDVSAWFVLAFYILCFWALTSVISIVNVIKFCLTWLDFVKSSKICIVWIIQFCSNFSQLLVNMKSVELGIVFWISTISNSNRNMKEPKWKKSV